ncbi:MAG: DUF5663 domain-containing protein [Candidatus Saccharibacteria bacterium]|nr:DUF5663 domain-containing protein [Candidatus Saccharibacteria bacterium]
MDSNTQILQALRMEDAPADVQQEIIQSVEAVVENRLMMMVDEMLTDEQRAEFEKIQEENDAVAARLWLEQHVVNTQELYAALLGDYLAEKRAQLAK